MPASFRLLLALIVSSIFISPAAWGTENTWLAVGHGGQEWRLPKTTFWAGTDGRPVHPGGSWATGLTSGCWSPRPPMNTATHSACYAE